MRLLVNVFLCIIEAVEEAWRQWKTYAACSIHRYRYVLVSGWFTSFQSNTATWWFENSTCYSFGPLSIPNCIMNTIHAYTTHIYVYISVYMPRSRESKIVMEHLAKIYSIYCFFITYVTNKTVLRKMYTQNQNAFLLLCCSSRWISAYNWPNSIHDFKQIFHMFCLTCDRYWNCSWDRNSALTICRLNCLFYIPAGGADGQRVTCEIWSRAPVHYWFCIDIEKGLSRIHFRRSFCCISASFQYVFINSTYGYVLIHIYCCLTCVCQLSFFNLN